MIEPTAHAAFSTRTVSYTDGSKSVASFSGSREYDPQGRVTETRDRFGGSTRVTYDQNGREDVTICDSDYVSTLHIDRQKSLRTQAEESYAAEEAEEAEWNEAKRGSTKTVDTSRRKGESSEEWAERKYAEEKREEAEWNAAKKEREKTDAKQNYEQTGDLVRRKGESMEAWCERRYAAEEDAAEKFVVHTRADGNNSEGSSSNSDSNCVVS